MSPALTIFAILLPLVAAANALLVPIMTQRNPPPSSSSTSLSVPRRRSLASLLFTPRTVQILQLLQGILTTVLATLFFQDMVPSEVRDCALSGHWQHLFRDKDAAAIKSIQDALNCCGFRSVKDMAWPFPPAEVRCAARFERDLACQQPWTQALRRSAGGDFGVVLVVGLLQARPSLFFFSSFFFFLPLFFSSCLLSFSSSSSSLD